MDTDTLTDADFPAAFELLLHPTDPSILFFRIHRKLLEVINRGIAWAKVTLPSSLNAKFGFTNFTPPGDCDCGFNNVFKATEWSRASTTWIEWEFKLPKLKVNLTGGEGDEVTHITDVTALRATLFLFSNMILGREVDTKEPHLQLMLIERFCLPDDPKWPSGCGDISFTISRPLAAWLKSRGDQEQNLPEVIAAMEEASEYMWPGNSGRGGFNASHRGKRISFRVPGDAGLYVDTNWQGGEDRGFSLHSSHSDTTLNQLLLVVGMAKLCELARLAGF